MSETPNLPVYVRIKRDLKTSIENGEFTEGDRVPTELELAAQYGVSRNSARQALRDLEFEGYVVRTPGRGSFVAPSSQRQRVLSVNGLRMVALACPELESRFTRSIVQGFINYATAHQYHTMVYFLHLSNDAEFDFLAELRNSGIEGIALALEHGGERTRELLRGFTKTGFPFVLIDRYMTEVPCDYVTTDNAGMLHRLTAAVASHGHRHVAYITRPLNNTTLADRFAGFRKALDEHEIPFGDHQVGIFDPMSDAEPLAVIQGVLAQHRRPTALVCSDDFLASLLVDELLRLGYSVPGDIEVASVDDNDIYEALDVPIVSSKQNGFEMGRVSAEFLLNRIETPGLEPQHRLLEATLHLPVEEEALPAGPPHTEEPAK
jgi:DNA-binding LacI/PurR family transcriptional regulator